MIRRMVHPAQVSAIPPRYHDTRKSRKNRRLDVMSDDVLKVLSHSAEEFMKVMPVER